MKIHSKSVKILAVVIAASFVGGIALFEHDVQGQGNTSEPLTASEPSLNRPPNIQGEIVEEVELSAVLSKDHKEDYNPLEPVEVVITLKNASKSPIKFVETFSSRDHSFLVKDSAGKLMPTTRYGYKGEPGEVLPSTATALRSIEPGESKQFSVIVNRMIDMTVDDVYSIVVYRTILADGKSGYVQSNELHVDVNTKDTGEGDISLPGIKQPDNPLE